MDHSSEDGHRTVAARTRGPRPRKPAHLSRYIALIAVGGVLAAAGCSTDTSGGGSGKTTVTFANWADAEPNTQKAIESLIKKFESQHPDITVKSQPIAYTDIEHQTVLQVQSGNPPDVAEMQGNYTFDLQSAGALAPLDGYAKGAYQKSVIPSELDLGRIDGKLMAVPWTVAPFALWYDKKVMAKAGLDPKPPATWDQLLTDLKAIHRKEPKVIGFGLDTTNRTYGLDENWPIMRSFGAAPFKGKTATADTPAMRDYLDFVHTLGAGKYSPNNQKGGFFRQPAASDQVAFTVDGPYVKGVVQSTNHVSDSTFYGTWGVSVLPAGPDGKHYSAPTDHQLVMFKHAKHKKAAWEFMQFLSTSEYAVSHYTVPVENSLPPLAKPPAKVAAGLDNPVARAFQNDVIPTVVRPEWSTGYDNVYSDVMAGVQNAISGSGSSASIAKSMQSAVSSKLDG